MEHEEIPYSCEPLNRIIARATELGENGILADAGLARSINERLRKENKELRACLQRHRLPMERLMDHFSGGEWGHAPLADQYIVKSVVGDFLRDNPKTQKP